MMLLDPNDFKFLKLDIDMNEGTLTIIQDGFESIRFIGHEINDVEIKNFLSFTGKPLLVENFLSNQNRILTKYNIKDITFKFFTNNLIAIRVGENGVLPKFPDFFRENIKNFSNNIQTTNINLNGVKKESQNIVYKLTYNKKDDEALKLDLNENEEILDYKKIGIEKYERGVITIGNNIKEILNKPESYDIFNRGRYMEIFIKDNTESLHIISGIKTHINENIIEFKKRGVE